MSNKKYLKGKTKEEMKEFLDQLEKSCGGHGAGILFVDNGFISFHHKSVDFSNEDIVELLYGELATELPDWFLYHTRVASVGTITDENCHPYINEDWTFSLMMNGTDRSFGAFGNHRNITDTQVIFEVMESMDIPLSALADLTPRFMGFKDGKVFATNSSGLQYQIDGEAICIASEFPKHYKNVEDMKHNFVWVEGEELQKKVVYANTYNYGRYQGYYENENYVDWYTKRYLEQKEKEIQESKVCTFEEVEEDNVGYYLEEVIEIVNLVQNTYGGQGSTKETLTYALEEEIGLEPFIDGFECKIVVLDNKSINILGYDGNIIVL